MWPLIRSNFFEGLWYCWLSPTKAYRVQVRGVIAGACKDQLCFGEEADVDQTQGCCIGTTLVPGGVTRMTLQMSKSISI